MESFHFGNLGREAGSRGAASQTEHLVEDEEQLETTEIPTKCLSRDSFNESV